jgi:hypothetical protein
MDTEQEPMFEVVGLVIYDPLTDRLTATVCMPDEPPISASIEHAFFEVSPSCGNRS